MDKETVILVIAQNGLKTAATLISSKAAKAEKDAEKAKQKDPAKASKLAKEAAKLKKLSVILITADEGITSYLLKSAE